MNRTRDTSLEAFRDVIAKLGEAQAAVWGLFREGAVLCDLEIRDRLGWTINRVTPRRGELVDKGLLELKFRLPYKGRRRCFWGRSMRLFAGKEVVG